MSMCHTKYKLSLLSHACPSIMIMVSYERRENELSNDVYIFEENFFFLIIE